ncbi:hypothetical protein [Bathycoccus sp. RCC716 virus 3]|nr:hypothetical protein [Bathycoccus sp. RCC716 virus 3]
MFKQWCKEQGFLNNSNVSHVLMDGGVLSVPFDRLNFFYEKCIEAYKADEKIFVVEQKTENYNFFIDIDHKAKEELEIREIFDICQLICGIVKSHGGGNALISVAEPKPACKDLIKSGVHINWPDFVVNKSSAIALREHVINALFIYDGSKEWSDIIDLAVYGSSDTKAQGSGFRMPYSHKKGKHEKCLGKGCEECNNTGKEIQGEYIPLFIFKCGHEQSSFHVLQEIQNPREGDIEVLKMATIRTQSTTPVIIEGAVINYDKNDKENSFSDEIKNEFKDQEVLQLLEKFINRNLEGQTTSRVTKMFECNGNFLVSTNSFYCENKKCNHNSNHVWFHILGETIAQKCFSTTDIIRHYGFCKDFTGKRHQLPPNIINRLYKEGGVKKYVPPTNMKFTKKKQEEEIKQYDLNLTDQLTVFIMKNMIKIDDDFKVSRIEMKKTKSKTKIKEYSARTNYTCIHCKKSNVMFKIIKNKIEQVCNCENRKHYLDKKIVDKL